MADGTIQCTPSVVAAGHNVRYEIHDRFTVPDADARTLHLEIWCPVIPETPYQRVLDFAVDAPVPWSIEREPEHGNLMLHTRFGGATTVPLGISLQYLVERTAVGHMLDPTCVRPLATPLLFAPYLQAERFVVLDDRVRACSSSRVRTSSGTAKRWSGSTATSRLWSPSDRRDDA
jgi:hypothetical protein